MTSTPATPPPSSPSEAQAEPQPAKSAAVKSASGKSAAVLAIDAMSGERGPQAVVEALEIILDGEASPLGRNVYQLFGDAVRLTDLLTARPALQDRVQIRHAAGVMPMGATPREAMRQGPHTSLGACFDAVVKGHADVAVSAGDTVALMTLAHTMLGPVPGLRRPAIAALWPSVGPAGAAVGLDMGANLHADPEILAQHALLGVEYARAALEIERPRVAVLNVGHEDTKGRSDLKEAIALLQSDPPPNAEIVGFVEADAIGFDVADVIVTDGFTGNIALKSAEGAAKLIGRYMRESFEGHWRGPLAAAGGAPALKARKTRIDPRRLNGGVFLGLGGLVVKSHGAADGVAFASALGLASRVARGDVAARIEGGVRQVWGGRSAETH